MKVRDLIKSLLEYPMDIDVTVYDRDSKEKKDIIYAGASPVDYNAWYDDEELPDKVSFVEILVSKNEK